MTRPLTAPERQARATAQAGRQARHDAVHRLRAEGKTTLEIAVELRMSHNTIQRLLRATTCPERAQRHAQATVLSAYEPYLRDRWSSGEQNGQTLLRELRVKGYRGSQATLYGFLGAGEPERATEALMARMRRNLRSPRPFRRRCARLPVPSVGACCVRWPTVLLLNTRMSRPSSSRAHQLPP